MSELETIRKYLERKIGNRGYILLVQTTKGSEDIDLVTNIRKDFVIRFLESIIESDNKDG